MDEAYVFTRQGRSARTIAIVAGVYLVLILAVVLIDAAWWLMTGLALFTLPAVWDQIKNPSAGVRLTACRLEWRAARRGNSIALSDIDHVFFATRWDFSVRVKIVPNAGKSMRIPDHALPPHRVFETALENRDVIVKRAHFSKS